MAATVLVVEDEATIREGMRELLELAGYRVMAASGGKQALEILHNAKVPCLVLLDLMMPEVNGWDLIQQMRADPRLQRVPVILISAVGDALKKPDGVAAVLQKPV